jgi:site-specific DNA recombinase
MSTPAAIYARVSSNQQREQATIASQTAALQAFAAAHDYLVPPAWVFEDEGYSGATLIRPGLEGLRDLAASGQIAAALVYAPDRLSRKYAYQILLTEELARAGVVVVFLQAPAADTAEDRLLLQVQGMIAEYERAQIAERTRRGKRHKAQCGVVNALSGAPYGYRYVKKTDHADAAYAVEETAAAVVRQVFAAYTEEGVSVREIARRLNAAQVPTRKRSRWDPSTIAKLLRNPAYAGRAGFGKTGVGPRQRTTRRRALQGRRPMGDTANHDRPRSEWLEIPVPPLISDATFALAQERLVQNVHFARRRTKTPTLLQGLLVCQQCGYSLYRRRRHYRCWGVDGYRHRQGPVCTNRPVRHDHLDAIVWREVLRLLEDPTLVQAELDRRLAAARQGDPCRQRLDDLTRQATRLGQSIERLVTAYQQDLVTLDELRDRMPALRTHQQALTAEREAVALASADQARYLRLSETLSAFRATLRARSDTLDVSQRQTIVRLVITEIRVDLDTLTICHSLPTGRSGHDPDDRGGSSTNEAGSGSGSSKWLLCGRRQGARLRPGEAPRHDPGGVVHARQLADHDLAGAPGRPDLTRRDPRHRRLHESGAGARAAGRSARRHLGVRVRAVRDAHRAAGVSRRDRVGHDQRGALDRARLEGAAGGDALSRAAVATAVSGQGRQAAAAAHRRGAPGAGRGSVR